MNTAKKVRNEVTMELIIIDCSSNYDLQGLVLHEIVPADMAQPTIMRTVIMVVAILRIFMLRRVYWNQTGNRFVYD